MKVRVMVLLALALCIALSNGLTAFAEIDRAAEGEVELQYEGAKSLTAYISNISGSAQCKGILYLKSSNYKATVTTKLQRKVGTKWVTVPGATWSNSGTGGKIESVGSKAMEHGYTYRVYATARVTDLQGNYIESLSDTSKTISY